MAGPITLSLVPEFTYFGHDNAFSLNIGVPIHLPVAGYEGPSAMSSKRAGTSRAILRRSSAVSNSDKKNRPLYRTQPNSVRNIGPWATHEIFYAEYQLRLFAGIHA